MKSYKDASERATQIMQRIYGHASITYKASVIDVFASPNDWINATFLYRERLNGSGYPKLITDDYTILVALDNSQLEEVVNLIRNDGLTELETLVSDLPSMRNKKEDLINKGELGL